MSFRSSGYASSIMAENPNTALFDNEICTMNDGKPFSETARLTSSYTYDFICTFSKYINSPLHYGPSTGNKNPPIPISAYGPLKHSLTKRVSFCSSFNALSTDTSFI